MTDPRDTYDPPQNTGAPDALEADPAAPNSADALAAPRPGRTGTGPRSPEQIRHRRLTPVAPRPDHSRRWRRHHAGEGIEDTYNVPSIILCGLALAALALTLTAAGYGFAGWAVICAVICVACGIAGVTWLLLERRRTNRRIPSVPERQGH